MVKFNDSPKILTDVIEDVSSWDTIDLEEKLKEWKAKYPDRKILLDFEPGSGCGCSYCSTDAKVEILATRRETPEEVEQRRKEWEEYELERKRKLEKKKAKKVKK